MDQQIKEIIIKAIIKLPSLVVMKHIDVFVSVLAMETDLRKGYIKSSEPVVEVNPVKKKGKRIS